MDAELQINNDNVDRSHDIKGNTESNDAHLDG